jgi:hypothetical protein
VERKKRKVVKSETSLCDQTFSLSLASVQLTRDADIQFYTGLSNTNVFKNFFDHLSIYNALLERTTTSFEGDTNEVFHG